MNVPLLYITVIKMLFATTPKDLGNAFVTKVMTEMELIVMV